MRLTTCDVRTSRVEHDESIVTEGLRAQKKDRGGSGEALCAGESCLYLRHIRVPEVYDHNYSRTENSALLNLARNGEFGAKWCR